MTIRERLFALEAFGIKLGLDGIRTLLAGIGRPERAFPSIHIAGTNGKGSVAAMVERGLRAAGHRTGLYTSPHLDRLEERVAIDGAPVDAAQFDEAAARVLDAVDRALADGRLSSTPTFFEVTTATAFDVFRTARVDAAVVEVGLGGRFDATNVITPAACAITSIALDHEHHLGATLAAIAREKGGIAKPGVPMVLGDLPAEAGTTIEQMAAAVGAPVVARAAVARDGLRMDGGTATVRFVTPVAEYPPIRLAMPGRHQVANAAVAVRLLEIASARGLAVDGDAIATGLREARWPARLEWLRVGAGELLVDAAHNPAGAAALASYLAETGFAPLPVVLAVMRDKDLDGIVEALAPVASRFVATTVEHPRAYRADDLGRLLEHVTRVPVTAEPDRARAVEAALASVTAGTPRAAAAGSIYFVGPLRARLIESGAKPI